MIIRIVKYLLFSFGCFSLILLLLCFTSLPFWTWYGLSTRNAGIHRPPGCIIVLGGGGMPSETGLMRTWYAAKLADQFQHAKVIIALPGNSKDSLSSVNLMKEELVHRGVTPDRIMIEDSGTNTRSQALLVFQMIKKSDRQNSISPGFNSNYRPDRTFKLLPSSANASFYSIVIVTSPEHLYRAVLSFKKAGFFFVDGLPAFDNTIESDITFVDSRLGGRKWFPNLGKNITIRYKFWSQMQYEVLIMREFFAIAYYWVKGWI